MEIASFVEERLELNEPINIHVTGCHHSCAQHLIADIGLIATKVEVQEEMREGFHIFLGGKTGMEPKIAIPAFDSVLREEVRSECFGFSNLTCDASPRSLTLQLGRAYRARKD